MFKKIIVILLCSVQILTFTSCYDADEIDNSIHVIAIGIDEGVSDKWRLTIQFSTMNKGKPSNGSMDSNGGSEDEDQNGYSFITIDAPSFFGALDLLNSTIPAKVNFMHAQFLVFSEELAKSGKIGEFIAPIIRYRQIRRTLHVMVTRGSAMGFIKENKPYIGASLSKNMDQLIQETENTGLFTHTTLNEFYSCIKSNYQQPYCALVGVNDFSNFNEDGEKWDKGYKSDCDLIAGEIPRKGGNKIEFLGTAFFDGDIMVGELCGLETRFLLICTGDLKRAFVTIPDPLKPELIVPLDIIQKSTPKVKVAFKNGKPYIQIKIELEGSLLAVQSRIKYEDKKNKAILEKSYEDFVKTGLEDLVNKCKDANVDILGFGKHACMHFTTIQEWEKYDWFKNFKDIDAEVSVEFVIRRTGSLLDSSDIVNSEGIE